MADYLAAEGFGGRSFVLDGSPAGATISATSLNAEGSQRRDLVAVEVHGGKLEHGVPARRWRPGRRRGDAGVGLQLDANLEPDAKGHLAGGFAEPVARPALHGVRARLGFLAGPRDEDGRDPADRLRRRLG